MHPNVLIDITAEVLRDFRHSALPADRVLARALGAKKFLGAKDRRFVGDNFFHVLRHLRRIDETLASVLTGVPFDEWLSRATGFPLHQHPNELVWGKPGEKASRLTNEDRWIDKMRVALAAVDREPELRAGLREKFWGEWPVRRHPWSEEVVGRMIDRLPEVFELFGRAERNAPRDRCFSFPEWMWGLLGYELGPGERDAAAAALNQPARPVVRVNTLRMPVEAFRAELTREGVTHEPGRLVPDAVVLERRLSNAEMRAFAGAWEFQDEGSQFLTEALDVRPGMTVVDACAGAGGKTLHLAQRMGNAGRLLVHEPGAERLGNLRERVEASGVTIVEEIDAGGVVPPAGLAADLVLLDVPCTGSGTIRRSPDLKWRILRDTLVERIRVQDSLLEQWCGAVAVGGVLAYATCSLFKEENGDRIEGFLARHPEFRREALPQRVPADARTRAGDVQLHPHRHGTDGFFLAVLRRTTA